MKSLKLFVSALMGCVLVGASSGAMARDDCANFPTRQIVGQTLDELVIDEDPGTSCTVVGSVIDGDVLVSSGSGAFIMKASVVHGNLRVSALEISLVDNTVDSGGNLRVGPNLAAVVLNNVVGGGNLIQVVGGSNLRVIDGADGSCNQDASVVVAGNRVLGGNMNVSCNRSATVRQNTVYNGNIRRRNNVELDSVDNDSLGGTESCSRFFEEEEEQEE